MMKIYHMRTEKPLLIRNKHHERKHSSSWKYQLRVTQWVGINLAPSSVRSKETLGNYNLLQNKYCQKYWKKMLSFIIFFYFTAKTQCSYELPTSITSYRHHITQINMNYQGNSYTCCQEFKQLTAIACIF